MSTPYPKRWLALALLCAAQFLVILDTSIIGIALPAMQRALGLSAAGLQWVFNAYVIVFGGLLLLGGRLADLAGRRRIFMSGFLVLSLGSLAAGLAGGETTLLVGRAIQGLGAALIAPSALSIVMEVFTDPKELSKAFGFWGGAAAAGGTAGVFLGGVITQWLSWRWTFLMNVPIGALVLLAAPAVLPKGRRSTGGVDVAGALTITGALVAIVYAMVTGEQAGWTSGSTLGMLGLGGLLLIAFVAIERRRRDPLVPFSIFRAPNLAAGNVVMALLGAAWIPMWFFLNLYLQEVLGLGAFDSGLALVPMTTLIMVLMMTATPKIVTRFGFKSNLVVGLALLAASMLLLSTAPAGGSFLANVLPASLVAALGMSLAYVPATIAAMSGAKPEETGLASGLVNTTYQIGSALGLAATTALSSGRIAAHLGAPRAVALTSGYQAAFVASAVVVGAAAVIAASRIRTPSAAPSTAVAPMA